MILSAGGSVTGTVSIPQRHNPFSFLLRIFPTLGASPEGLGSTPHEPLLEKSKTLDKPNGYYIEIVENDDKEIYIKEETEVDGDNETSNLRIQEENGIEVSNVKLALGIDTKQSIRIESLVHEQKAALKRQRTDAKLDSFATLCDNSLSPDTLQLKTNMYFWILVISGVFYILPTIQLMFVAQMNDSNTGNEAYCYYNFLCRVESAWFDDYGHIFSNIFYILVGSLFIILVAIRRRRKINAMVELYCERHYPSKTIDKNLVKLYVQKQLFANHQNIQFINKCGIPEQYGTFFALGGAVIFEGLLSSCYHICPLDESFQFDTTFMYVAIALCLSKVYEFRHPDISLKAHVTLSLIAVTLLFETLGYYSPPNIYLGIFLTFFIGLVICNIWSMYYHGGLFRQKEKSVRRVAFLLTLLCMNLGFAGLIGYQMFITKDVVVSDFLLFLLGANYIVCFFYYGALKYYYVLKMGNTKESITFTCWIYIVLTIIFGVLGMYYFVMKQKKTGLSSSESRHLNSECTLWFFDQHDIWHFASALAIFFHFMSLLTLEDNNSCTPWNEIPVF